MRAIVLAAGEGSRLKPLTRNQPKVMLPVANRPIAEHVVEALVSNGIREITIVVGYRKDRVQSHFEDGKRFGARIRYAFQEPLLGTAHALSFADFGKEDALVLSGDNVVGEKLVSDLVRAKDGPAMVVQHSENPSKYGVVTLKGSKVQSIVEKPKEAPTGIVNTGIYYLPKDFEPVLREAVKNQQYGLPQVLDAHVRAGSPVRGVVSKGLWVDVVYPWDLLRVNTLLQASEKTPQVRKGKGVEIQPGAVVSPPAVLGDGVIVESNAVVRPTCALGDGVTIGAGSTIENCVLFPGVDVGPGSVLTNAVLAAGVRTGSRTVVLSGPCDIRAEDGWTTLQDFGAVVGEDVAMEGAAILEPGAILGNRARVGAGVRVRGTVEDGAILR